MEPVPSANNPKATRVRVTTTSIDERMSNIESHSNDVSGTGAFGEGVPFGRCPVDQQRRPGCHAATAEQRQKRLRWSKDSKLNSLMYAAAYVTTERMGMIKRRKGWRIEEPFWKRRIKGNIEPWRKDLSKIEEVRRGNMRLKQREGKVKQKISS